MHKTKHYKQTLRVVKDSITTHFDPWVKVLFFLSIFSPQKTATCVAKLIMGMNNQQQQDENQIHYCINHKRNIDTSLFAKWLTDKVSQQTIMKIRNLAFFATTMLLYD